MTATITDNKPLAVNMAAYIALYSGVEAMLQGVFEKAIGGDGSWADSILHHVQSINTRMDIVEDFLSSCRGDTELAKAILPLIPRLREANTYRNKLAHGVFIDGKPGLPMIASNMFARKKSFRQESISAEMVLAKYHELEQLYLEFLHGMGLAPKGFPTRFDRSKPSKGN